MGELAARTIFSNDTGPLAGTGLDTLAKNQGAILELEGARAPQSKTITDGSISPTAAYVIVDTEGSSAADDLGVISPVLSASENLHDGMVIYLRAADSGRVVTVKNSSSVNGINTYDGNDYVLSATHWLKLQLRSGKWYEVEGRAMETALAAATAAAAAATAADHAQTKSGTSSTASGTAAKVVACSGFELSTNARIFVTFSNANTVADAITINVNGTGAKSVYNQTGIVSASNTALFAANQPIEFRYDGTGWVFYDVTNAVSSGTYAAASSTAAGTAAKEATCSGFTLADRSRVFVTFSNNNTVAGALTLDVNSTGAKPIYLGNSAASATNPFFIPAGVALEFVYNGTAWVHTSCIIESWENSSRGLWYKKWSNGLIEQGLAGNGPAEVTFPTPFLRSDKTRFYKPGLFCSDTTAYSPTFVVQSDSLTGAAVSPRINGGGNGGLYWTFEVSGY